MGVAICLHNPSTVKSGDLGGYRGAHDLAIDRIESLEGPGDLAKSNQPPISTLTALLAIYNPFANQTLYPKHEASKYGSVKLHVGNHTRAARPGKRRQVVLFRV